jgi:hypothetical protein
LEIGQVFCGKRTFQPEHSLSACGAEYVLDFEGFASHARNSKRRDLNDQATARLFKLCGLSHSELTACNEDKKEKTGD